MTTFALNEVVEYSDLSAWEDATIIGRNLRENRYIIRFHEDSEMLPVDGDDLRRKENTNA